MSKYIFWDFQGTLAKNDWMLSKALYKVLRNEEPDTHISIEDFKTKPMLGFPWHDHEKDYLHLTSSDNWWKNAEDIFAGFYKVFGISEEKALYYAKKVRLELIKPDEFYLYEDTVEMLCYFKQRKFTNIILSNHVPELESIVGKLGLSEHISQCISSSNVGYEKPNPQIYKYALDKLQFIEEIWMVGDNIIADVKGAESVGIKGVLVRSKNDSSLKYHSDDLRGLKKIII